ncbi:MAG: hypothetical protein ACPGUI_00510 [Halarcobacter sp.]
MKEKLSMIYQLLQKAFELRPYHGVEYCENEFLIDSETTILKDEVDKLFKECKTQSEYEEIDMGLYNIAQTCNFLAQNHDILSEAYQLGLVDLKIDTKSF